MQWTEFSLIWLLLGECTGLLAGGFIGFVIGIRSAKEEWRDALLMVIALLIVGTWIAAVICSMAIGYVIPVGIHTVAGVVVGSLFGKDAVRRIVQNGGGK